MQIQTLSDFELVQKTKILVSSERKITAEIIQHLSEINRRKIFAERGYSSLFDFAVKELGYSETSAYRRIAAMKLVNEIPETKEALAAGTLSLATVSKVQSFLYQEKRQNHKTYSVQEKRDLLDAVAQKPAVECEKILAAISPQAVVKPERERRITETKTEIRITVEDAFLENLKKFQELSRMLPNASYAEILSKMAKVALAAVAKKLEVPSGESTHAEAPSPFVSRYVPQKTKAQVWTRDQGRCQFQDPITKRKCEERNGLQFDHIIPFAKNGETTTENLRLLCFAHNQLERTRHFGENRQGRSEIAPSGR